MSTLQNLTDHARPVGGSRHDENTVWLRLRNETRAAHESIEKNGCLKRLLADDLTRSEYAGILRRLTAFYVPVEREWLRWAEQLPAALELEARAGKAALLFADLAALQAPAPDRAAYADFAPFDAVEQAWGCIYVIEGSTMGGQLIARSLLQTLKVTSGNGASFYSPYGTDVGAKWQAFKKAMSRAVDDQNLDLDKMIDGAQRTFSALDRWMAADQ
ncbi:putative Bacteriophytochrome heme oxygenase, BphO-like [Bradyrhizobium sp. ORS 278]|uniref:biliverdin-producing heme oxygenase n=1 Tax=Bradyrhizobium sp. (strain ORS 278) TaxID=114615 RepID=UPI0001507D1E|nr:biliverdin-producing heme oxygenase [Bradyrhizobium sp. ORS 278]CAL75166.1 putative Bacteriophytochrome heme oxygenase, BphO-like [Bradyrhizobium sp. ORS 278]